MEPSARWVLNKVLSKNVNLPFRCLDVFVSVFGFVLLAPLGGIYHGGEKGESIKVSNYPHMK